MIRKNRVAGQRWCEREKRPKQRASRSLTRDNAADLGVLFILGGANTLRQSIPFTHVGTLFRRSVIPGAAEMIDLGVKVGPDHGVGGAMRLGLRLGGELVATCRGPWRVGRCGSSGRWRRCRGSAGLGGGCGSSGRSRGSGSSRRRSARNRDRLARAALVHVSLLGHAAGLIGILVGAPLVLTRLDSLCRRSGRCGGGSRSSGLRRRRCRGRAAGTTFVHISLLGGCGGMVSVLIGAPLVLAGLHGLLLCERRSGRRHDADDGGAHHRHELSSHESVSHVSTSCQRIFTRTFLISS